MSRSYRVFESLKVAILATFISGFINAYTYNTQDQRFAGAQTGNVFMMMIHLVHGDFRRFINASIPVVVFILGQFLTYFLRQFVLKNGWRWHAFSAKVLCCLLLLTALLNPYIEENLTIALLALFASIELETFKRVHHLAYANIMMTGNLKNAALALVRGIVEKKQALKKQAYNLFIIITSFMAGVFTSTVLTIYLAEMSLYALLLPLLVITALLHFEKVN